MKRTRGVDQKMRRTVPKKMVWYEDYDGCKCTYIIDTQRELPGHCPSHLHSRKNHMQIPDVGFERGFVKA